MPNGRANIGTRPNPSGMNLYSVKADSKITSTAKTLAATEAIKPKARKLSKRLVSVFLLDILLGYLLQPSKMKAAATKEVTMPTGHVKFFDPVKGFGFVQSDEGAEAFLHVTNLPDGVTDVKPGTRVEYSVVDGKRGAQVLSLRIIEVPESLEKKQRAASRMKNEDLVILVEGLISALDKIRPGIEHGRLPEGPNAEKLARLLRTLADQLKS